MIVRGKDVVFSVLADSGDYVPICCARNASLVTNADIGETSTLGTGKWKTFKGLKLSFTISAGGLVSFDMNYSIAVLRQKQFDLNPLAFQFYGADEDGAEEVYSGNFIVTSISTPSSYNANFEYSMEGQGTGEPTIQIVPSTTRIYIGWHSSPFTTSNIVLFNFQKTGHMQPGATSFDANYTGADGNYLAIKFPTATIPAFTKWFNTNFNYGTIPDQIFNSIYTSGDYSYIYSRVVPFLDANNKTITFS